MGGKIGDSRVDLSNILTLVPGLKILYWAGLASLALGRPSTAQGKGTNANPMLVTAWARKPRCISVEIGLLLAIITHLSPI